MTSGKCHTRMQKPNTKKGLFPRPGFLTITVQRGPIYTSEVGYEQIHSLDIFFSFQVGGKLELSQMGDAFDNKYQNLVLDSNEFLSKSRWARSLISSFRRVLLRHCREKLALNFWLTNYRTRLSRCPCIRLSLLHLLNQFSLHLRLHDSIEEGS